MSLKKIYGFQDIATRAYNSLQIQRKAITNQKLALGISNYNQVLPQRADQAKYGFFRAAELDNRSDHNIGRFQPNPPNSKKIARIYIQDDNRMHQTPIQRKGYKWNVQFERGSIVRLPFNGWTYSTDSLTRYVGKYQSLEEAMEYCQQMGVGYQIQYPRFRYTVRKSYADNFRWKGFAKEEADA